MTCATPDNRAPGVTPTHDPRNTSNGLPAQRPRTMKPVATEIQPASVNDDGPPLLVFILPSLALIAMLAAATVCIRSSHSPAHAWTLSDLGVARGRAAMRL